MEDIPLNIVIIGSGTAGITVAEELRNLRPDYRLCLLTRETHGFYSRPLLSHGFSRDDIEQKIVLKPFAAYRSAGIEIRDGVDVRYVDRAAKTVTFRDAEDSEATLAYDRLVFALGSDAFIPPPFRTQENRFHVLNSLSDLLLLRRLRAEVRAQGRTPTWGIVGGGLIGCELASDLAKSGDRPTLFHALPRLMERQLEEEDSETLLQILTASGVTVHLEAAVRGFRPEGERYAVETEAGSVGGFDRLIVACGFKPRVELALAAGLLTHRGILVNECLATSDPHIHAVGDVAECLDGRIYAYIMPIRSQALWLSKWLAGLTDQPWEPPFFKPKAKVHGFTAAHPYLF